MYFSEALKIEVDRCLEPIVAVHGTAEFGQKRTISAVYKSPEKSY